MVMHLNKDNEQNRDKFGWSEVYCDNEVVSIREKAEWDLLSTQRLRASFSFLRMIQLHIYLSLSLSIPPTPFLSSSPLLMILLLPHLLTLNSHLLTLFSIHPPSPYLPPPPFSLCLLLLLSFPLPFFFFSVPCSV